MPDLNRVSFPDTVVEFRPRWAARGRWCPPRYPLRGTRVRYRVDAADVADLPGKRRGRWANIEDCARSLAAYWDTLPTRHEPTQKGYGAWATMHKPGRLRVKWVPRADLGGRERWR